MKVLANLFKKKLNKATLVIDPNGINFVGGKPDSEVIMPELETSPMVYIGYISKNESHLPLIDFDLHLICPLFIDLQSPVFLNYTDSMRPTLIRDNVSSNLSQYFEDIPNTACIEYTQLKFSFQNLSSTKVVIGNHNIDLIPGKIGQSGIPDWIHDESWPNCPITENKMKFLFQLGDIDDCKTKLGQDILDKESIDPYLHFGHGYLYVFYEPDSKVVAFLNQL